MCKEFQRAFELSIHVILRISWIHENCESLISVLYCYCYCVLLHVNEVNRTKKLTLAGKVDPFLLHRHELHVHTALNKYNRFIEQTTLDVSVL